jgi:predicted TIM-barrel fold metal-dependent hydrolase
MFKGVKYVPNDYAASGSAGFIAGTVRIGGSATERMNFLLGLKKDGKGEWQISSEMFTMISPPPYSTVIEADTLIKQLDDAGIKHGVIAALGYLFGSPLPLFGGQPRSAAGEEYPRTRAENDWTIAQASRYPDRLFVLCGVNPLKDYAVEEIQRCSKLQQVKGMKIHFANSGVNMLDPDHVEKVRRFFKAANDFKMPVLAHVRQIGSYNSKHAEAFVNQVLPSAPDIPIQLAHMASGGPPDEATEVYVRAIEAGDPRVKNIYFDITHTVAANGAQSAPALAQIAQIFRRIGIDRIFFGSDLLGPSDPRLTEHWEAVRKLPLTDEELRDLADNVPPYLQ